MENEEEGFSGRCPGKLKRYYEGHLNSQLRGYGITAASVPFLMVLSREDGMSLKTLTSMVGMDRAHTTRVISKLTEGGFVEDSAPDRKEYSVRLTARGHDVIAAIVSVASATTDGLLSCLTDEERAQWDRLWTKVNRAMDQELD